MKALTVWQPSAWAICAGFKDVENRARPTNVRGRVLIHAAKGTDSDFIPWVSDRTGREPVIVNSAIIGFVSIDGCVPWEEFGGSPWACEFAGGGPGQFCWLLSEAGFLEEPIPHAGQLGFWTPKGDINVDPAIAGGAGRK